MKPSMRFFWTLATAFFLLAISAVLTWLGHVDGYSIENRALDDVPGETIRARLYVPEGATGKRPGVLLCHGANNSKETMRAFAIEFARRGFVVLAFDFGGHGESYQRLVLESKNEHDVSRALATLADHPLVDSDSLVVVGHSMGARAATTVSAHHKNVRATVAIGMAVFAEPSRPKNLLLLAGLYDQLHSPNELIANLRTASGIDAAVPDTLYGSFETGTARQLSFSPHVDHILEPYDPWLIKASADWVEQAVRHRAPRQLAVRTHYQDCARLALIVGTALLLITLIFHLLGSIDAARLKRLTFRRLIALLGAFLCLVPLIAARWVSGDVYLLADFCLALMAILLVIDLLLHSFSKTDFPWQRLPALGGWQVLKMLTIVGLAWYCVVVTSRLGTLSQEPDALLSIPALALEFLIFYPYHFLLKLRQLFFTEYSTSLVPSRVFYGVLLVELASPGQLMHLWLQTVKRLFSWLELYRKTVGEKEPRVKEKNTTGSWLLVGVLLMVLAGLVWQMFQMAPVNRVLLDSSWIAFRFVILPLMVMFLLVNLTPLRLLNEDGSIARCLIIPNSEKSICNKS